MTRDEIDTMANRFFAAIEDGNIDAVAALYDDDVRIWHNVTRVTQDRSANLELLRLVTSRVRDFHYEDIRREIFDGGFAQQHTVRGTNPAGVAIEVPVCLVVGITDGYITRIDEYLDGETVRPMFAD